LAVLLIGDNDLTNTAWSATAQSVKEAALAKESPRIVGRIEQAVQLMLKGMPDTKVSVFLVI
jgi:hypothetical protein